MKTVVAALVPLVVAPSAHAAVDSFLCIQGVTGTCTIVASNPNGTLLRANGWVAVGPITWGGTNTAPASDPYGPGTPSVGPVEVIKAIDDLSPTLFLYALQGTPLDVQIVYRKATASIETEKPFIQIQYTDIQLTVSQFQLSQGGEPQERITFEHPAGMLFSYWKTKLDGTQITPPYTATWPPVTP